MSLSLSDLTKIYSSKGTRLLPVFDDGFAFDSSKSGLDNLSKLFLERSTGLLPERPSTWRPDSEERILAICMLIVDELPHEAIWRAWLEGEGEDQGETEGGGGEQRGRKGDRSEEPEEGEKEVGCRGSSCSSSRKRHFPEDRHNNYTNTSRFCGYDTIDSHNSKPRGNNTIFNNYINNRRYGARLFIHAKHPEKIRSAWVRQHMLNVTFRPEWNSPEVVRAMLAVLEAAVSAKDTTNLRSIGEERAQDYHENKQQQQQQPARSHSSSFSSTGLGQQSGEGGEKEVREEKGATKKKSDASQTLTEKASSGLERGETGDVFACGRFIFATESCLPLYPLQETAQRIFQLAGDISWMDAYHSPKSSWESGACFQAVDTKIIPRAAIWKAFPGWIALTRKHATEIIALRYRYDDLLTKTHSSKSKAPDLVSAWGPGGQWSDAKGGVFAPEEVFFPTMLAILGYLRPSRALTRETASQFSQKTTEKDAELYKQSVTFAHLARNGDANPIAFESVSTELWEKTFRRSGALFARKFPKNSISLSQWQRLVRLNKNNSSSSGSTSSSCSRRSYVAKADPETTKKAKLDGHGQVDCAKTSSFCEGGVWAYGDRERGKGGDGEGEREEEKRGVTKGKHNSERHQYNHGGERGPSEGWIYAIETCKTQGDRARDVEGGELEDGEVSE